MKLNLGANDRNFPDFLSVDIVPPADIITDLSRRWPWVDSTIEEVKALDVIEHIADRIHFMNELHRVMMAGSLATVETPNASKGVGYFQDCTHKSPWCLSSFKYFEKGAFAHGRLGKSYGITAAFKVLELSEHESSGEDPRERVWKIRAVLEAVK